MCVVVGLLPLLTETDFPNVVDWYSVASDEFNSFGSDINFKTFVAVFAEDAKSNVCGGTRCPSTILILPVIVVVFVCVVPTSVIGFSTSCCKFLSSEDLKLVDKLSLDAKEVDKGELRSTDDATSIDKATTTLIF